MSDYDPWDYFKEALKEGLIALGVSIVILGLFCLFLILTC